MSDLEDLIQAVGRAWCHPETSHLPMDTELAEAIIDEVLPLLIRARTRDGLDWVMEHGSGDGLAYMDALRRGHTIDITTEAGEVVGTIDAEGQLVARPPAP